jgi:hypothetical protein
MDKESYWRRWSGISALVTAIATVFYVGFTAVTIRYIKGANDLTRKYQEVMLRPYINVENMVTGFKEAAQLGEVWNVTYLVSNSGGSPAKRVRLYAYFDHYKEIMLKGEPEDLIKETVTRGTTRTLKTVFTLRREEVKKILEEYRDGYMHVTIWYNDIEDRTYVAKYTFAVTYVEGKVLDWSPVFVED